MKPTLPAVPAPATEVVAALGDRLPSDAPPVSELIEDLIRRWSAGERPVAEDYLNRHPTLWTQPGAALKLIWEEHLLRERHGEPAPRDDYFRRFPQWQVQLDALLSGPSGGTVVHNEEGMPRVGEPLGDFHLVAELGRGALGSVFLARQANLADRPVVLKVTPGHGSEHLSLARLQHTHIVPLYSVSLDTQRGLRILCMPWFGGASLGKVLDELRTIPPGERTGKQLAEALERLDAKTPIPSPGRGTARQYLTRSSYPLALCWIASCLADALDYAHLHEMVHLDLKPSNVL